jgi:hypothetical protein
MEPKASCYPQEAELRSGPVDKSLEKLLEEFVVKESELRFIKGVIGEELLRENSVLKSELESLLMILSDLQSSKAEDVPKKKEMSFSRNVLAPAPLLHQRLRALIESHRVPVENFTDREKMVAEYVLNGSRRPPSAGGRPLSQLSSRSSASRPSSASSSSQSHMDPNGNLEGLKAKLKFYEVHNIKGNLIELFKQEKELLLEDVEWVRSLIEEEMRWDRFSEPLEKEVNAMATQMEQAVLHQLHEEKLQSLPAASKRNGLPSLTSTGATPTKPSTASPPRSSVAWRRQLL